MGRWGGLGTKRCLKHKKRFPPSSKGGFVSICMYVCKMKKALEKKKKNTNGAKPVFEGPLKKARNPKLGCPIMMGGRGFARKEKNEWPFTPPHKFGYLKKKKKKSSKKYL